MYSFRNSSFLLRSDSRLFSFCSSVRALGMVVTRQCFESPLDSFRENADHGSLDAARSRDRESARSRSAMSGDVVGGSTC